MARCGRGPEHEPRILPRRTERPRGHRHRAGRNFWHLRHAHLARLAAVQVRARILIHHRGTKFQPRYTYTKLYTCFQLYLPIIFLLAIDEATMASRGRVTGLQCPAFRSSGPVRSVRLMLFRHRARFSFSFCAAASSRCSALAASASASASLNHTLTAYRSRCAGSTS